MSFSVFLQDTSASVYSDLSLPPVPDLESFDIDSSVFQFWNPDLPGGQKSAIVAVTLTSLTQVTGGEPSLCPIVIDETINIAGYTAGETRLFDINPVSIAVGDSVDMTVRFAGGLSLHMGYGNEWFRAWLSGTDQASSFTIENIRVQFLGFSEEGGALDLLAKGIETSGIGHMGPQFPFFLSPGQAIEFTGYRATFDVTSLDVDPNTYRNVLFRQSGDDVFVIPEPTPALLHVSALVVLAALAAAKRRALYRAPGGTPT